MAIESADRGVAQPGQSARFGGGRFRWFESSRPDFSSLQPPGLWAIVRSTDRATFLSVSRSLHVRLDDSSAAALSIVRGGAMSDSEAVRTALRESAARRRARSSIAEEVRRLAAADADRAEMQVIREQMAELAPDSLD